MDALDECGRTAHQRRDLLALLTENFVRLPSRVRTVIMSRAESDISNVFTSQPRIIARELDITTPSNSDDVFSYLRHGMALIRDRREYLRLGPDWPGEEALHLLAEQAYGLFAWASAALEFIDGHDPRKRLDVLIKGDAAPNFLDSMYTVALASSGPWDDEDFVADFRDIMGVILFAHEPLSTTAIDALLQLPNNRPSLYTISLLGGLLQLRPVVRVLHPSFADFLTTSSRCGRDIWFFERSSYNRPLPPTQTVQATYSECSSIHSAVLPILNLTLDEALATDVPLYTHPLECISADTIHVNNIVQELLVLTQRNNIQHAGFPGDMVYRVSAVGRL